MGLTTCEDCGQQVSTAAATCPHCGRPMTAASVPQPTPHPAQSPTPVAAAPAKRAWVRRHPIWSIILALIVIGAISSAFSHHGSSGSPSSSGSDLSAASAAASVPITGRISGAFQDSSGCLGCGSLVQYIHVDRVWCGWQGNNVIIHVRFRNDSVEHVTVSWHPSYVIAGGGSHGGGLTSIQSISLASHATRAADVSQSPKGVSPGSAIGQCDPAFEQVSSG